MAKIRLMIVLVVLALVAVGCGKAAETVLEGAIENQLEEDGGGDVNVNVDEDGGSISIETDEGSVNIGGTEIPDDFPLPVPDYEEVVGVVTQTGEFASSMVTLSFDPDDFDDVAALYEDFFDEDGWEVSRTESNADGDRMVIFYASKDAVSASAIVGYNDGEETATVIAQYGNN
jgi:hypothetical protein